MWHGYRWQLALCIALGSASWQCTSDATEGKGTNGAQASSGTGGTAAAGQGGTGGSEAGGAGTPGQAGQGEAGHDAALPTAGSGGTAQADAGSGGTPSEGELGGDIIYQQDVARADSYWTEDGRLYHGAEEIHLYGLNWFGLDGPALALYGPTESGRSVPDFLAQIEEWGFNALRIPLSPESIRPDHASEAWAVRDGLETGRQHFEELAQAAADAGIYMLWDIHTCANAGEDAWMSYMAGAPDDPDCGGYDVSDWLDDLETLAALAQDYAPYVVGIDLFNEPHDLDWSRWRDLASQGGERVLRENPHLLVFVEGIGAEGYEGPASPFWGENLMPALDEPIELPESRLVYSPHVYGPSVYAQDYFDDPSFPENMPAIWDAHFGFLADAGEPVVPGELGGRYTGSDQVWQDAFVDYLLEHDIRNFFYWSLNPNSGDTGGLLQDDWQSVEQGKLELLQRLMQ